MTRRLGAEGRRQTAAAAMVAAALVTLGLAPPLWCGLPGDRFIPTEDITADLETFTSEVTARSAYLLLTPSDLDAAVDAVRQRNQSGGGLTVDELAVALQQILTATGDPGAQVLGFTPGGPFLPFAIVPLQDRYVATWHDGAGFLIPGNPYLSALDGDPVSLWLGRLNKWLPAGPATYRQRSGLAYLQAFGAVQRITGELPDSSLTVRLTSTAMGTGQDITLALTGNRSGDLVWPQGDSALLAGNIGYLRLPRMGSREVDKIRRWMPNFERTAGLIVDVRGNRGKSRDALQELWPYFMRFDDPPFVVAATLFREHPGSRPAEMADMVGQPVDWPHWRIDETAAIKAFRDGFVPADSAAAAAVGPWRYLVVTRQEKDPRYPYLNSIILLMDGACSGSTELLLATCKGRFKITLMGTPSGGVPDQADSFILPRSNLEIRVSSLITYMADGRRLGAASTEPDILSFPEPESFLPGGEDVQLEFARKYLTAR